MDMTDIHSSQSTASATSSVGTFPSDSPAAAVEATSALAKMPMNESMKPASPKVISPPKESRKERKAAKSFGTAGVNLGAVRHTPSLPAVVDIASLCSLDASFDEEADRARLEKMKQWQRNRKMDHATKVLSLFMLSVCLRRRYVKFCSAVLSMQTNFRRLRVHSHYSAQIMASKLIQKNIRGYWVRNFVRNTRLLVLRLERLRVAYNLKVSGFKKRSKAATIIQCTIRIRLAQRKLCQLFEAWKYCSDVTVERKRIISEEIDRKKRYLSGFVSNYLIRATMWFSLSLVLLNILSLLFSFSDAGIACHLKEVDMRYVEGQVNAPQLYYPDSTNEDMISSLMDVWVSSGLSKSVGETLLEIQNLVAYPMSKSELEVLWCVERAPVGEVGDTLVPSLSLSRLFILSTAVSVGSTIWALTVSIIVSYIIYKGHDTHPDPSLTYNWRIIRSEKDNLLKRYINEVSDGVIYYSTGWLLSSWVCLSVSVMIWLLVSRFHYFWFVLPFITDICEPSVQNFSLGTSVSTLVAPMVQFLNLKECYNSAMASMIVQFMELLLFSFVIVLNVRLIWGYRSMYSRIAKNSVIAQEELTDLSSRINSVMESKLFSSP